MAPPALLYSLRCATVQRPASGRNAAVAADVRLAGRKVVRGFRCLMLRAVARLPFHCCSADIAMLCCRACSLLPSPLALCHAVRGRLQHSRDHANPKRSASSVFLPFSWTVDSVDDGLFRC